MKERISHLRMLAAGLVLGCWLNNLVAGVPGGFNMLFGALILLLAGLTVAELRYREPKGSKN